MPFLPRLVMDLRPMPSKGDTAVSDVFLIAALGINCPQKLLPLTHHIKTGVDDRLLAIFGR